MDDEVEISCSFRFLSLAEDEARALQSACNSVGLGTHFKTGNITASVELSEAIIPALKEFILGNAIPFEERDIFISVSSAYDTRIIDIPECVNRAVISLGAKMVFSYTCLD